MTIKKNHYLSVFRGITVLSAQEEKLGCRVIK